MLDLLMRTDRCAAMMTRAETHAQKDGLRDVLVKEVAEIFDGRRIVLSAEVKNVVKSRLGNTVYLKEQYREIAQAESRLRNIRTFFSNPVLHLDMPEDDLVAIQPGMVIYVRGTTVLKPQTGLVRPSTSGNGIVCLQCRNDSRNVDILCWDDAECEINGEQHKVIGRGRRL